MQIEQLALVNSDLDLQTKELYCEIYNEHFRRQRLFWIMFVCLVIVFSNFFRLFTISRKVLLLQSQLYEIHVVDLLS